MMEEQQKREGIVATRAATRRDREYERGEGKVKTFCGYLELHFLGSSDCLTLSTNSGHPSHSTREIEKP